MTGASAMNGRSEVSTFVEDPERFERLRRRMKRKRRVPEMARRPITPETTPPIMAGDADEDEVGDVREVGAAVFDEEPAVDELHEKLPRSVLNVKLGKHHSAPRGICGLNSASTLPHLQPCERQAWSLRVVRRPIVRLRNDQTFRTALWYNSHI